MTGKQCCLALPPPYVASRFSLRACDFPGLRDDHITRFPKQSTSKSRELAVFCCVLVALFIFENVCCLSGQHASAADGLDLFLGQLGEKLGLDNDGLLGQHTLAQHFEETLLGHVNHRHSVSGLGVGVLSLGLCRHLQ